MHWEQYKLGCCVFCRDIVIFVEVQNVLAITVEKPVIWDLEEYILCPYLRGFTIEGLL